MKVIWLLTLLLCHGAVAQDLSYTRSVINTLCSDKFKGRGYVKRGDHQAANFIQSEFEKAGVKKIAESYTQQFTIPVNTFPGSMTMKIGDQLLYPGKDFIVDPRSPGIKGKFKTVNLSAAEILNDKEWKEKIKSAEGKIVVVEAFDKAVFSKDELAKLTSVISFLQTAVEIPVRGVIIISHDKLTWSVSTVVNPRVVITVRSAAIHAAIDEIELNISNVFIEKYQTKNILGYIEGERKDSVLVFTAHYDHLGMMGKKTMFPGANDNASGVAFLLNLVKYYAMHQPKYTTVFIAFAAEEIGLLGSKYFVEHPLIDLRTIKFLINFDMAGTGDDGIQIVNGKIFQDKFNIINQINMEDKLVNQIKTRGEACNSDHCMFYSRGVPCFFIYTLGGIQAYHDVDDKAETLPLTDFADYFRLVTLFVARL